MGRSPAPPACVRFRAVVASSAMMLVLSASSELLLALDDAVRTPLPAVENVSPYEVLVDTRPVTLTIWTPLSGVPYVATRDRVRSDPALWLRMHLSDWNTVPDDLRREGLRAMLYRYSGLLHSPAVWDRMRADDWDWVPQPVRVLAYARMLEYWAGLYGVGDKYALGSRRVVRTLTAIVMSESWFEHRAVNGGPGPERDLGLGQASPATRERLRELYARGAIDFDLADDDYFNPWYATRFVAVWMRLLLDEAAGDLDLAIRTYHRGRGQASDARGTAYLAVVRSRLEQFIRNTDAPPAWADIWTMRNRAHAVRRHGDPTALIEALPFMATSRPTRTATPAAPADAHLFLE